MLVKRCDSNYVFWWV